MIKEQKSVGWAVAAIVAALYSAPGQSAVQVWNFDDNVQNFTGAGNGNFLDQSSGGINLTTTGWSDTVDVAGADQIESGEVIWAQTTALGVVNRDEDRNSPNHSVDSFRSGGDTDGDFDMLLLTFDEAVTLTGIDLGWALDGTTTNRADISILAWDGTGSAALGGRTWANVLSNYDSVGNYSNVGLNYYAVSTTVASTKWLIGAYNPVFGGTLDGDADGFKLSQVTTSNTPDDPDPPEVPVPGTVALLLAGLFALRVRKPGKAREV